MDGSTGKQELKEPMLGKPYFQKLAGLGGTGAVCQSTAFKASTLDISFGDRIAILRGSFDSNPVSKRTSRPKGYLKDNPKTADLDFADLLKPAWTMESMSASMQVSQRPMC